MIAASRRVRGFVLAALTLSCLVATACGTAGAQVSTSDDTVALSADAAPVATTIAPVSQATLPARAGNDPAAFVPQAVPQPGSAGFAPEQRDEAAVSPSTAPQTAAADSGWSRETAATAAATLPAASSTPRPASTASASTRSAAAAPAPTDTAAPDLQVFHGVATYYGWDFQGRPMAAGPTFNMMDPTVTASNYWPLGTRLRIWRVAGGPWDSLLSGDQQAYYFSHSIIVTVMDRGAFTHALDLSYGAFAMLGSPPEGVISVMIQPLDGTQPSWQLGSDWQRPAGS